MPITDGIIGLANPGDKTPKYTFNTDANGDYKGTGIAPGTYTIFLRQPTTAADKVVDQFPEVKITAGADTLQDFDLTRPAYMATLTPEQRKTGRGSAREECLCPERELGHQKPQRQSHQGK